MKKEKKGVGKPTLYKKAMKRVNVMLDEDTIKFYTLQGKGNLSKGIREHRRGLTPLALDAAIQPPAEHVKNSDIIPAGEVDSQPRQ